MKKIISLGSMCWTRWLIDIVQGPSETLLFDWIDVRSFKNVYNVIKDILKETIDYDQFVTFDEKHLNPYGMWFGHYDPPPARQKDSNLDTFKRRIERFKENYLDDQIEKIFVLYNRQTDKYQETIDFCQDILNKSKNQNNSLLIINHVKPDCDLIIDSNKIIVLNLKFKGISRDENNTHTHITFKDHFIPACEEAGVMNILTNLYKNS